MKDSKKQTNNTSGLRTVVVTAQVYSWTLLTEVTLESFH